MLHFPNDALNFDEFEFNPGVIVEDGQENVVLCNLKVDVYDSSYCAPIAGCGKIIDDEFSNGLPAGWEVDGSPNITDRCGKPSLPLYSNKIGTRRLETIVGKTYRVSIQTCEGEGILQIQSADKDTTFNISTSPSSISYTFVATQVETIIVLIPQERIFISGLVVETDCPRPPPSSNYRFRYNGKEFLSSGLYDYGFRMYHAGLGRFLSVDPYWKKFPGLSSYQFSSNTPIQATDLDGAEGRLDLPSSDPNVQRMTKIQRQNYDKAVLQGFAAGAAFSASVIALIYAAPAAANTAIQFGSRALLWSAANPQAVSEIGTITISAAAAYAGYDGDLPGPGDEIGRGARALSKAEQLAASNLNEIPKVISKAERLAANNARGLAIEREVLDKIEANLPEGHQLLRQVTAKTNNGLKTRLDAVQIDADGIIQNIFEVKSGNAELSKGQKAFQDFGGTFVGKNASKIMQKNVGSGNLKIKRG